MRLGYLLRRAVNGLVAVVGVAVIVFVATHLLADPARKMLPLDASEAQYLSFRHELGLDRPLLTQFGVFLKDTARFDLGTSISQRQPAAEIVLRRLPRTLTLLAAGLTIAALIGIPLGIVAALKPGSWIDSLTTTVSFAGLSLPQFWLGAMLILLFAVELGLLPTSGIGGWEHLVLPALAIGLPTAGRLAQVVRSTMIDELQRQYVLAARARGLGYSYILARHVLRNALVPITSYFSLETARAFAGGTVVVETVFAYPGLGQLAVESAKLDDIVLMQAIVIVVAVLVVVTNIASELVQAMIDPRIRAAR